MKVFMLVAPQKERKPDPEHFKRSHEQRLKRSSYCSQLFINDRRIESHDIFRTDSDGISPMDLRSHFKLNNWNHVSYEFNLDSTFQIGMIVRLVWGLDG